MRVYFETYGCTMNKGDTELAAGLVGRDHEIVDDPLKCDVAVVNSCGVIGYTERKILKRIRYLKNHNVSVILTGCLPKINPPAAEKSGADAIVPIRSIGEVLKKFSGETPHLDIELELQPDRCYLPLRRSDGVIAIVPISEGCLGNCSYCATKKARGGLRSRAPELIIREVKKCVEEGYREIQLTAQDTGSYGLDIGERLPDLLQDVSQISGDFRVRVGMMNPTHVIDILDELIESFESEKIYKFLHLPLQSGDDDVLRHMKRGYTVQDFISIVEAFRRRFPEITISTDVIVGYPTEDEKAFSRTKKVIERIEPDILNITRFSKRPGTEAAKLKDTLERTKKERSRELTVLHREMGFKKNQHYLNRELTVLITEMGKNNTVLGRTDSYKQVVLKRGNIGEFLNTKIVDFTPTYLIGT
jgi:MiaB-like tRNA modifying enzyme